MTSEHNYGYSKTLTEPYDKAITKVTEGLKKEGFGILTEINIKDTLKKKLDVDFRNYIILGACNPKLAHQALSREMDLGLFLPCNVIVYENDEGRAVVTAINPVVAMGRIDNPNLEPIAQEASTRLQRVIAAL